MSNEKVVPITTTLISYLLFHFVWLELDPLIAFPCLESEVLLMYLDNLLKEAHCLKDKPLIILGLFLITGKYE